MRPALACCLALTALASARGAARAQAVAPPALTMELAYVLGAGAERCPDEARLHRELARRIGYDPFAPDAAGTPAGRVRVVIARGPRGLVATYDRADAAGVPRWTRTYPIDGASARRCEEAIEGIAVDLQVEFPLFKNPPAPSPPAPIVPVPPPPPIAAAPAPLPVAPARPRLEIGSGAFIAAGASPAPTLGGAVHVGVELSPFGPGHPWLSFAVEGRADAPAAGGARGLQTSLLAGSAVACGHQALLTGPAGVTWAALGCVVGSAGRIHGRSQGVSQPLSMGATYAGLGPRLGIEARLGSLVAIRIQGDVLPTILSARLLVDDRGEAWRTADVAGNAGLAVVLFF